MVVPAKPAVAETPDRASYYQAGKGNVLSHFAGLATPDVAPTGPPVSTNGVQLRQRRSHAALGQPVAIDVPTLAASMGSTTSTATAMAPSPLDAVGSGNQQPHANVIVASDDDNATQDAAKPPREVALSLWKLERQQEQDNGRRKFTPRGSAASRGSSRGKSITAKDLAVMGPQSKENDNQTDGDALQASGSMFSIEISPPRHRSSMSASRSDSRSSGIEQKERRRWTVEDTMAFLQRDLAEHEVATKSKSDAEKAFIYQKRYIDAYGLVASLCSSVTVLREKLRGGDSGGSGSLRDETGEERVDELYRHLQSLSHELAEQNSLITSLHDEKNESTRALEELQMSRATLGSSTGLTGSQVNQAYVKELEEKVVRLERENAASAEQAVKMNAQITEMQRQLAAAEGERQQLQNTILQTEQHLESVHTQWLKEKSDLLEATDDSKRKLSLECEKLRRENAQLKKAAQQASEGDQQLRSTLESAQRSAEEADQYIKSLETEFHEAQKRIASFAEKEDLLVSLQERLQKTEHELKTALSEGDTLRKELAESQSQVEKSKLEFRDRMVQLERRIFEAEVVRRSLHNKVMELKGNIRVFCRVRPVLRQEEEANGDETIFNFPDYRGERRQIELIAGPRSHVGYGRTGGRESVKKYPFDFDLVFNGDCSQEDVFLEVSALIQSALDGFNVCIFAYGQTGSGKTYTMQGPTDDNSSESSSNMGIVGRAISHIYAMIEDLKSSGWTFSVSLEMIEIYNETLRDLLAPPGSTDKVDLRLDSEGKPMVTNSCVHTIEDQHAAWNLLQKAIGRRATKSTSMNDRSSRSHCVISFRLNGVNSLTGDRRVSVVHLVDLAGSERLSKSGSGNDRDLLKETQCINKSLSSLGNVICALAKKSSHVPFRDSKLTHFLSPSLGGESKTLMICNLSPLRQHRDETLNSLRFAKTVNSCEIAYPSYGNRS